MEQKLKQQNFLELKNAENSGLKNTEVNFAKRKSQMINSKYFLSLMMVLTAFAAGPLDQSLAHAGEVVANKKTAAPPQRAANEEPPILAGAAITVMSYDKDSNTYVIKINAEPAVGPNIATPKALASAIGLADRQSYDAFIKNPARAVGNVYVLYKDLKLLVPN